MVHDEFFVAEQTMFQKQEKTMSLGEVFDENDNPVERHKEAVEKII